MEERISAMEQDVRLIQERNRRVEADKAWEVSMTRIGTIVTITYIVACVALVAIGNDHPFRNALIPTVGFFLSTQSLPFLKKSWIRSHRERPSL